MRKPLQLRLRPSSRAGIGSPGLLWHWIPLAGRRVGFATAAERRVPVLWQKLERTRIRVEWMKDAQSHGGGLTFAPALTRVAIGVAVGVCVGVGDVFFGPPMAAPLVGWDGLALTYLCLTWWLIWPLSPGQTALRATRHDPTQAVSYLLLTTAAMASLLAVGVVLFQAKRAGGVDDEIQRVGFGVASIVMSWAMVHTVYALRYATIHYSSSNGGVDFNEPEPPSYRDFAYLAFTIGMTFQVSDTPLRNPIMRRTALLHALMAYALVTVILAATVNLIAGLSH